MTRNGTILTPWFHVPLSIEFSRQKYWSRLPFPILGDLPYPGIKPESCVCCIGSGFFTISVNWEAQRNENP